MQTKLSPLWIKKTNKPNLSRSFHLLSISLMFINNCLIVIGQDFTWPTPKNITEVQAFQKCKTTVEASIAFQGCKDVPDIGFSVSLDSCVIDIQVFTTNHGFMFHALVTLCQCSHSSCQETLITIYEQKAFCLGIKLKSFFPLLTDYGRFGLGGWSIDCHYSAMSDTAGDKHGAVGQCLWRNNPQPHHHWQSVSQRMQRSGNMQRQWVYLVLKFIYTLFPYSNTKLGLNTLFDILLLYSWIFLLLNISA